MDGGFSRISSRSPNLFDLRHVFYTLRDAHVDTDCESKIERTFSERPEEEEEEDYMKINRVKETKSENGGRLKREVLYILGINNLIFNISSSSWLLY